MGGRGPGGLRTLAAQRGSPFLGDPVGLGCSPASHGEARGVWLGSAAVSLGPVSVDLPRTLPPDTSSPNGLPVALGVSIGLRTSTVGITERWAFGTVVGVCSQVPNADPA